MQNSLNFHKLKFIHQPFLSLFNGSDVLQITQYCDDNGMSRNKNCSKEVGSLEIPFIV